MPPFAQGVIVADDQVLHADAVEQHTVDELGRRGGGGFKSERDNHQHVDPGPFDQLDLLRGGRNQPNTLGAQYLERVGIEGHGHAGAAVLAGAGDHLVEQLPVAQVHAVEVADGHVRTGKGRRNVCEFCINVHDARLLRSRCPAGGPLPPAGRAAASVKSGYVPQFR